MKFLIVVIALCIVGVFGGLTDEQKTKLKEHKTACLKESKADEAAVDAMKQGTIPENDEKLKCYYSCMMKRTGIMNADGTFNEQTFRSKMPPSVPKEKVDEIITKCKDQTGTNECDTAFKLVKCYLKEKDFSIIE